MSTLSRKAWGDLRRHRARTVTTVFTLSLAVASLAILAVPGLADRAMDREVQADRLYDVAVATRDLVLTPAQLGALGRLPGVAAADADVRYPTQVTVAVATGLALALFAAGRSIAVGVSQVYGAFHYAILVDAGDGSPLLGPRARSVAAATPGITRVEPVAENSVAYQGTDYQALGLGADPLYQYRLSAGRWFTAADAAAAVPGVVLGPALARASHATIGQELTLGTAAGPARVRVAGIDTGQSDNGGVVYFPLAALQRLTGMGGATNVLWLTVASTSHGAIDRAATAVADRLASAGYPVGTQELYVAAADNAAVDNTILSVIEALGLLVVAIALMGLVSALTMGVIERTREIGILRCLGARAGHIRRVFSVEGILLAAVGWAFGVPVGWLIYRALIVFVQHDFGVWAPVVFPAISAAVALVAVVAVTLVVIWGPLHRATRIQPGGALRYQ